MRFCGSKTRGPNASSTPGDMRAIHSCISATFAARSSATASVSFTRLLAAAREAHAAAGEIAGEYHDRVAQEKGVEDLKQLVKQIARAFAVPAFEVEEALSAPSQLPLVHAFLDAEGPSRLLVYQREHEPQEAAGRSSPSAGLEEARHQLFVASAEADLAKTQAENTRLKAENAALRQRLEEVEKAFDVANSDVFVCASQGAKWSALSQYLAQLLRYTRREEREWGQLLVGADLTRRSAKAGLAKHMIARACLLYTSPSPRDATLSRMPSSA